MDLSAVEFSGSVALSEAKKYTSFSLEVILFCDVLVEDVSMWKKNLWYLEDSIKHALYEW